MPFTKKGKRKVKKAKQYGGGAKTKAMRYKKTMKKKK